MINDYIEKSHIGKEKTIFRDSMPFFYYIFFPPSTNTAAVAAAASILVMRSTVHRMCFIFIGDQLMEAPPKENKTVRRNT